MANDQMNDGHVEIGGWVDEVMERAPDLFISGFRVGGTEDEQGFELYVTDNEFKTFDLHVMVPFIEDVNEFIKVAKEMLSDELKKRLIMSQHPPSPK